MRPVKCLICMRQEKPGATMIPCIRVPAFLVAGNEPLLADESGNFVVLFFVPERAGHAAAASVQVDHFSAGNAAQQI